MSLKKNLTAGSPAKNSSLIDNSINPDRRKKVHFDNELPTTTDLDLKPQNTVDRQETKSTMNTEPTST